MATGLACIRRVKDDEVEAWCACPRRPGEEGFERWRDGERAWVEQWKTPPKNLFVYEAPNGDLVGKYDVPIEKRKAWTLWAPTVRTGPGSAGVMDALCAHQAAEARRRKVQRVELLLEHDHAALDLARASLLRAGFQVAEERVVVKLDLDKELPPAPVEVDARPVLDLPEAQLRALCHASGVPDADDAELDAGAGGLELGLVAWEEDAPVGLALAQASTDEKVLLDHAIGLVPEARGRGLGKALLRAFLAQGKERGREVYIASTVVDNEPMRRVFAWLGAETIKERTVFRL